jgi:hypothetical protein
MTRCLEHPAPDPDIDMNQKILFLDSPCPSQVTQLDMGADRTSKIVVSRDYGAAGDGFHFTVSDSCST